MDWEQMPRLTGEYLRGVWGSSGSDVFAVGNGGTILHYDGAEWMAMDSGTSNTLYGVWGSSGSNVFAVGKSGTIRHYDGNDWVTMTTTTTTNLLGVWGSAADNIYACGEDRVIIHYDGNEWRMVDYGIDLWGDDLHAIWGTSAQDVYVAGNSGAVLHFDGTQWFEMDTNAGFDIKDIWGTSASNIIVVGYDDVWDDAAMAHYNGLTWYSVGRAGSRSQGVWGSSASDIFTVGDEFSILHFGGQSCVFDIDPRSATFPKSGGMGSFDVEVTPDSCVWNASQGSAGITVFSSCGIGDGVVSYTVDSTTYQRYGYITVMDQRHDVLQLLSSCEYDIDPGSAQFGSLGGSGTFSITTSLDGCGWEAESMAYWLSLDSAATGTGNDSIAFSVDENPGTAERTGIMKVQGLSYVVKQAGSSTPVITVGGSAAAEPDEDGAFTLYADPAPSSNLTINYTVGGSASPGADYDQLSATTVVPAGQTSVAIPVAVINDSDIESNETVSLDLQAGSGYTVGPIASSTITIVDDDGKTGPYSHIYLPMVIR
jgi:hypothetical protein